MHTRVEGECAGEFHMPPGGDEHIVPPLYAGLHDKLPFSDRIVVQQRPDQAIDGITSEIFGNGQYLSASMGGGDDVIAASYGERQRLFAHRVQSEIQERGADSMMGGCVRGAVRADQSVNLIRHSGNIGKHLRSHTQEIDGLVRQGFAFAFIEIADRRQTNVVMLGSGKFGQSGEMTSPHAAASHNRHAYKFSHRVRSLSSKLSVPSLTFRGLVAQQ